MFADTFDDDNDYEVCDNCDGQGWVIIGDDENAIEVVCEYCGGTGEIEYE